MYTYATRVCRAIGNVPTYATRMCRAAIGNVPTYPIASVSLQLVDSHFVKFFTFKIIIIVSISATRFDKF